MPEPKILCPHCQQPIPLTETLNAQLRAQLQRELEAPMQRREAEMRKREQQLEAAQCAVEEKVAAELGARLAVEKARLTQEAQRLAREASETQLKDLQSRAEEQARRLKEAQDTELALRKKTRELEQQQSELDLELARKIEEQRKKIHEDVSRAKDEEQRLKMSELEKKSADQLKLIEELKRKAEQGSQQTQGEVLELDLEKSLREAFPQDTIEPVPKGIRGADLLQRVRLPSGRECGVIIWEAKRTKAWGGDWITKLKEDRLAAGASIAVLISNVLPKELRSFGEISGVWVAEPSIGIGLASVLRAQLLELEREKQKAEAGQGQQALLYNFLFSPEFKQRVEGILEHFTAMKQDLDQEKRAYERLWAKREKHLDQILKNTHVLCGSLEGILGTALPPFKPLELPGLEHEAGK